MLITSPSDKLVLPLSQQEPSWVNGASELSKSQSRDNLSKLFGEFPTFNIDEIFGENPCEWMTLNNFECGKLIGSGGFADVYLARESKHHSIVVLKVLSKGNIEVECAEDLLAEILIQAKLEHDNILPVFSFFYDDKNIYLILEYVADGSLREHVHDGKSVSELTAARYVADLVAALDYIHSQDIIHQDLKTENLFLGVTGNLIVADFGWAASADNQKHKMCTNSDNVYWAPETYGGLCGKEGDIWALGVLLYEFLVGTPPFGTKADLFAYILNRNICIPYPTEKCISDEAKDLISQLLEKDPNNRISLEDIRDHVFMFNNLGNQAPANTF